MQLPQKAGLCPGENMNLNLNPGKFDGRAALEVCDSKMRSFLQKGSEKRTTDQQLKQKFSFVPFGFWWSDFKQTFFRTNSGYEY